VLLPAISCACFLLNTVLIKKIACNRLYITVLGDSYISRTWADCVYSAFNWLSSWCLPLAVFTVPMADCPRACLCWACSWLYLYFLTLTVITVLVEDCFIVPVVDCSVLRAGSIYSACRWLKGTLTQDILAFFIIFNIKSVFSEFTLTAFKFFFCLVILIFIF
jgi:hypothetical protein